MFHNINIEYNIVKIYTHHSLCRTCQRKQLSLAQVSRSSAADIVQVCYLSSRASTSNHATKRSKCEIGNILDRKNSASAQEEKEEEIGTALHISSYIQDG